MLTITKTGNWKIYWGVMPLPKGAEALGLVKRDGLAIGALIRLGNGNYVQGNYGGIRTLNNKDIDNALAICNAAAILGSVKSERKTLTSRNNGKLGGRPNNKCKGG